MKSGSTARIRAGVLALAAAMLMIPAVPAGAVLADGSGPQLKVVSASVSVAVGEEFAIAVTPTTDGTTLDRTSGTITWSTDPDKLDGQNGSTTIQVDRTSGSRPFSSSLLRFSFRARHTGSPYTTIHFTGSSAQGPYGSVDVAVYVGAPTLKFTVAPPLHNTTALPTVKVGLATSDGTDLVKFVPPDATTGIKLTLPASLGGCTAVRELAAGSATVEATFSNCTLPVKTDGTYVLQADATGGSTASATSSAFWVDSSAGTRLEFHWDTSTGTTPPVGSASGVAFPVQPVVVIRDTAGRWVQGDNSTVVHLSIYTPNPTTATLYCPDAVATRGIATFFGCKIDQSGSYTLRATSTPSKVQATSASFTVGAATPDRLAFTTQPVNANLGTTFPTAPVVAILDAAGNVATTSTKSVTLAISNNPGAGTLTCSTSGRTVTAVAGYATFTGCSIDKAGVGYTLGASASLVTGATSAAFTVGGQAAPITIMASSNLVNYGTGISLNVSMTANGAYRTIGLQQSFDSVNWTTLESVITTDAYGNGALALIPRRNAWYRATFPGLAGLYSATTTATVYVGVRETLTIAPAPSTTINRIHQYWAAWITTVVTPHGDMFPRSTVAFRFYQWRSTGWVYLGTYSRWADLYTGVAKMKWYPQYRGTYAVSVRANGSTWNSASPWKSWIYFRVY